MDVLIEAYPEDSLCYSDDEDQGVLDQMTHGYLSEEQEESSSASDHDDSDADSSDHDMSRDDDHQKGCSPKVIRKPLTNQEKLHALDLEMKEKMKDLHSLMAQGDLTETVTYMNECFGIAEPASTSGGKKLAKLWNPTRNNNMNSNHTVRPGGFKPVHVFERNNSQSEETIYKNAVAEKRNSSSSEDNCVDISDESLRFEYFVAPQPGSSHTPTRPPIE